MQEKTAIEIQKRTEENKAAGASSTTEIPPSFSSKDRSKSEIVRPSSASGGVKEPVQ